MPLQTSLPLPLQKLSLRARRDAASRVLGPDQHDLVPVPELAELRHAVLMRERDGLEGEARPAVVRGARGIDRAYLG
jgi:hypothetical protein